MEQQLEQLSKAVTLAETQAMGLLKSEHPHHVAYTRTSQDGTVSNISAKGNAITRENLLHHIHSIAQAEKIAAENSGFERKQSQMEKLEKHTLPALRRLYADIKSGGDINAAFATAKKKLNSGIISNTINLLHDGAAGKLRSIDEDGYGHSVQDGKLVWKDSNGSVRIKHYNERLTKSADW